MTLIWLFILSLALYLKGQWSVLHHEFELFVEKELGQALNGRVSIKSLEGGLLDSVVLEGLKIGWDFERLGILNFEGQRVCLNYTLWDMLSQKFDFFRPLWSGDFDISIENGRFFFRGSDPGITNLSGRVKINRNEICFEQIQAQAFNMPLDMEGRIWGLEDNPEPKIDFRLRSDGRDFRGLLCIANTLRHPHLSGEVQIANRSSSGFVGSLNLDSPGLILVDNLLIRNQYQASGRIDLVKKDIFLGLGPIPSSNQRIPTKTVLPAGVEQESSLHGQNPRISQSIVTGPYLQNSVSGLVANATPGMVANAIPGMVANATPGMVANLDANTAPEGVPSPTYEVGMVTNSILQKNKIEIFGDFSETGRIFCYARLNHLNIGEFDIVTELQVEAERKEETSSSQMLEGRIRTFNTILNYKPFEELEGKFILQDGMLLKIPSLRWADAYMVSGEVKLRPHINVELDLNIKESDLSKLFLLSEFEAGDKVSGSVKGHIHISGPLSDLQTKGRLNFARGNLGQIYYESANINLVGSGPILELRDSRILREDGYLELSGKFHARSIFEKGGLGGLELKPDQESIMWKGWDITRPAESPEFKMRKRVDKEFQVTFKGYLNHEQNWEDPDSGEEFGVEYKLGQTEKVRMQLKKDEEFFSLEHRLKF